MERFALALLRSLRDRAESLRAYLRELQSQNFDADFALNRALEIFVKYPYSIVAQADGEWDEFQAPASRVRQMQGLLSHLLVQEETVDTRFARAGQTRIPGALIGSIREECNSLKLGKIEPVVTVGAPGNFRTIPNIHRKLFENLYYDPQPLEPVPTIAIITVPFLEGTRPAWHPLVIGHEVAHLKIEYDQAGIFDRLRLRHKVEALLSSIGELPKNFYSFTKLSPELGPTVCMENLLRCW